jgi:hypothetical protein
MLVLNPEYGLFSRAKKQVKPSAGYYFFATALGCSTSSKYMANDL